MWRVAPATRRRELIAARLLGIGSGLEAAMQPHILLWCMTNGVFNDAIAAGGIDDIIPDWEVGQGGFDNQSVALKTSIDEYGEVLESQNNLALLNKAIQAGQISMIEYFVDVTTLYQSMQNHMQLQNEYQKVMAQLYKFKL